MYQRTSKGLDRIKMFLQLALPPKTMKWFPPHFMIRDVALELVEKTYQNGERCILCLFDIQRYSELKHLYPQHVVAQVDETVQEVFRHVVRLYVEDENIVLMQKYFEDDYILILKHRDNVTTKGNLQELIELIQDQIEIEIAKRTASFLDMSIRFQSSFVWLEEGHAELYDAIHQASRDARAIAKQRVSDNIGYFRSEIKRIIEEEDLHVLAQPIVSLDSGEVEGWEILARGPKHTMFASPLQLFNIAHQTHLLLPLELLVIKKAMQEIEKKNNKSPIFINVTVPSLQNTAFKEEVMKLLQKYPTISPKQLVLEITEQHDVSDFYSLQKSMNDLRDAGIRFAIDDTGAGYANLGLIADLLPDFIKIDRSLIQNIDQHEVKDSILQALMLIAEKIGCPVVAEGIETAQEARVLINKKVNLGQGYFFSTPQLPFPQVTENWIEKQRESGGIPPRPLS